MDMTTTRKQEPRPKPTDYTEMTKEQKAERAMVLISLAMHNPPPTDLVCAIVMNDQWEDWGEKLQKDMEPWGGPYIREVDARAKANGYRDLEKRPSPTP